MPPLPIGAVLRTLKLSAALRQGVRTKLPQLMALAAGGCLFCVTTPGLHGAARASDAIRCPWFQASPSLLKDGFRWSEGPVWVASEQHWIFSDVMGDSQFTITPDGTLKPFRTPSGYANGNNLASTGYVITAQHDRQLVALDRQGRLIQVLANSYDGKKLNSPNGIAIAPDGAIWFTDPPMGISGYGPVKAAQELPFQGVFRLKQNTLSLMDSSLHLPNGIAFSNDGKRLYVSDTKTNDIYVFEVSPTDGSLTRKRLFVSLKPIAGGGQEGVADGLKVDRRGNLWATGPGGISVFDAAGQLQCQIPFPGHVADLSFGGAKGNLVLVASADKLYLMTANMAL